jgi:mono/diheme cytochrome c family protein
MMAKARLIAKMTVLSAFLLGPGTVVAQKQSYGETEYMNSCAACHGPHGKGDGPMAKELKTRPADLTVLQRKNGGEFPYYKVFATIDGRYIVPGHGNRDMPIWGRRFLEEGAKTLGPLGGEATAQERIHELTEYIASLQRPH